MSKPETCIPLLFVMLRLFLFQLMLVLVFPFAATAEEAWQLTRKAWDALAVEDWEAVEKLANQATRAWGAKAKDVNDGLTRFPAADKAGGFANLNELATIMFLKLKVMSCRFPCSWGGPEKKSWFHVLKMATIPK